MVDAGDIGLLAEISELQVARRRQLQQL
jgi:hypothetical protein